jgi:hypothetical protein
MIRNGALVRRQEEARRAFYMGEFQKDGARLGRLADWSLRLLKEKKGHVIQGSQNGAN